MSLILARNRSAAAAIVTEEFPRAASILADYLRRITGGSFPIRPVTDGRCSLILRRGDLPHVDAFRYFIQDQDLVLEAAGEQGAVYAVYDFLEQVCGCRYYTAAEEYVPFGGNLTLDFPPREQVPVLDYREVYYRDFFDPAFAEKHKMTSETARDKVWGTWCHSFQEFLSPEIYFDDHPEYFALHKGQRVGKNAQPCLSNPEVLEIVCENLKKAMEARPECRFWSVSQNDNDAHCTCDACRALDEAEGSPMGSLLTFVNRVAERFPEKTISTLAYWYTRKPPKTVRPAKNVHIMLCNIEANRGLPIAADPLNAGTREELETWEGICSNISLWDYCIQFKNLVSPFPNLRVIPENIRYFRDHSVKMLFSQSNREYEGEFSALRGYLLAKCMWDPELDGQAVLEDFCRGYYGPAAAPILAYIRETTDAMEAAGGRLSIFGGPKEETDWLDEGHYARFSVLMEEALEAVRDLPEYLHRVKTAAMPVWYAGIVLGYGGKEERLSRIARFAAQARRIGLEKVEEWTITPEAFLTDALAELNRLT